MVIADPLSGSRAVDYWQAHQNLNIDPTTPEKVTKPVDYWQAHQHLNIEAYPPPGLSYWDAHQHLDVDPVASAN